MLYDGIPSTQQFCFHRHQTDTVSDSTYYHVYKNHHNNRHHHQRALKAAVARDGYWCTTTTPEFQNGKMRFAQFADSGQ